MAEHPPISCFTASYGRVRYLEEVLECFLRQDYPGKKELVILNDLVGQELIFNHPEVVIVNHPERITPLGRKFNRNIELCSHGILACMESDDIYLPHHLSHAVENMRNGVYHSGVAFVFTGDRDPLHFAGNYYHSSHVFTRELFDSVGGYPEIDNCAVDVGIMGKLNAKIGPYTQHPADEDTTMIYRWCTGLHASGWGPNITDVSDKAKQIMDIWVRNGQEPMGKVILEPKWRNDYVEMHRKAREVRDAAKAN